MFGHKVSGGGAVKGRLQQSARILRNNEFLFQIYSK